MFMQARELFEGATSRPPSKDPSEHPLDAATHELAGVLARSVREFLTQSQQGRPASDRDAAYMTAKVSHETIHTQQI